MASGTIGDKVTAGNNVTGAVADYGSCAEWHATLGTNETATGTIIRIGAAVDTSTVTLSAGGTGTRTLTAHADAIVNAPTHAAATSRARVEVSSGKGIDVTGNNWTIEKIAILDTATDDALCVDGIGAFVGRRLVIQGANYGVRSIFAASWKLQNSAVVCLDGAGTGVRSFASDPATLHHVSVLSSGTGLLSVDYAYATVVQTSGTCDGGGTGGTDNVTQDSSARGGNVRTGVSGIFKDTGSTTWDLNLNGLNGGLLQGVADYSGSADTATDLNGNARPAAAGFPIDPGCAQIASGPSVLAYADSGNIQTSSPSTISITVDAASRYLLVGVTANGAISNVTWNGTAMTVIAASQFGSGSDPRTEWWYLSNPATGTHNVSFEFAGSKGWACAYVVAIANDSNAPQLDAGDGATFNSAATSVTKSTTTAVANEGCLSVWAAGGDLGPTTTSPQVLRAKSSSVSFHQGATGAQLAVSSGSNTCAWGFNSGAAGAFSVAYIKPGAAGATPLDMSGSTSMPAPAAGLSTTHENAAGAPSALAAAAGGATAHLVLAGAPSAVCAGAAGATAQDVLAGGAASVTASFGACVDGPALAAAPSLLAACAALATAPCALAGAPSLVFPAIASFGTQLVLAGTGRCVLTGQWDETLPPLTINGVPVIREGRGTRIRTGRSTDVREGRRTMVREW